MSEYITNPAAAIVDLDFVAEHIVVDGVDHVCIPADIWNEITLPVLMAYEVLPYRMTGRKVTQSETV